MEIVESIIHGIKKEKDRTGPGSVEIKPRNELLELDDKVKVLCEDIHKLYGKLSNSYGTLGSDPDLHRFPKFLQEYFGQNLIELSHKTIHVIGEKMSSQRFTTTSYPIFIHYKHLGRNWLLIAVLKLKEGVGIDEQTLDLNESLFFDVGNLREAARIDIDKWKQDEQPYLSFIKKGSGADSESSVYFREALSCLDYTDAKYNTDIALKALQDYCEEKNISGEEKQKARAALYDYFKNSKEENRAVNMQSLSSRIDEENPTLFIDFIREKGYEISDVFSPHPDSYKRFKRLTKRFGTISLGFDVDDLFHDRVMYNKDDNTVVIRNPPPDLVEQINEST